MLGFSLGSLSATLLLGACLALARGSGRFVHRLRPVSAAHGVLGAAGLAALVPVLEEPPRGVAMGAGSFGAIAAVLLAAALLAGFGAWLARRRRAALASLVLGLHATLAVSGFVLLAVYAAMPA